MSGMILKFFESFPFRMSTYNFIDFIVIAYSCNRTTTASSPSSAFLYYSKTTPIRYFRFFVDQFGVFLRKPHLRNATTFLTNFFSSLIIISLLLHGMVEPEFSNHHCDDNKKKPICRLTPNSCNLHSIHDSLYFARSEGRLKMFRRVFVLSVLGVMGGSSERKTIDARTLNLRIHYLWYVPLLLEFLISFFVKLRVSKHVPNHAFLSPFC